VDLVAVRVIDPGGRIGRIAEFVGHGHLPEWARRGTCAPRRWQDHRHRRGGNRRVASDDEVATAWLGLSLAIVYGRRACTSRGRIAPPSAVSHHWPRLLRRTEAQQWRL